jgi:hypothetical protein
MLSMKSVDDVWSSLLFKRSVDKFEEFLLLRGMLTRRSVTTIILYYCIL